MTPSKPSVAELLRAWRGDDHAEKCGCAICTAIEEVEAVAREMRGCWVKDCATWADRLAECEK